MKTVSAIFILVFSAVSPGVPADGEMRAVHKPAIRNVAVIPIPDPPAKLRVKDPVATTRRVITLTPLVKPPVVEPPIPASDPGEFANETPVLTIENGESVRQTDAEKAIGVARSYYMRELWESAAEWYLKALDWDPANFVAAEGFVMSAFHAGQYNYAYRIGEDISDTIPGVKEEVIKAANGEIDMLFRHGRLEQAGQLLDQFPLEEQGFSSARKKLEKLRHTRSGGTFQTQTDSVPSRGIAIRTQVRHDRDRPGERMLE